MSAHRGVIVLGIALATCEFLLAAASLCVVIAGPWPVAAIGLMPMAASVFVGTYIARDVRRIYKTGVL